MRRFFWVPKHMFKLIDKNHNFTLKRLSLLETYDEYVSIIPFVGLNSVVTLHRSGDVCVMLTQ